MTTKKRKREDFASKYNKYDGQHGKVGRKTGIRAGKNIKKGANGMEDIKDFFDKVQLPNVDGKGGGAAASLGGEVVEQTPKHSGDDAKDEQLNSGYQERRKSREVGDSIADIVTKIDFSKTPMPTRRDSIGATDNCDSPGISIAPPEDEDFPEGSPLKKRNIRVKRRATNETKKTLSPTKSIQIGKRLSNSKKAVNTKEFNSEEGEDIPNSPNSSVLQPITANTPKSQKKRCTKGQAN